MRRYFLALGLMLVTGVAVAEENASNPLAAVNNVDLRWQFTSADAGDTYDVFVDGAYMLTPKLKLKYELHYNFTDVIGSDENDFEKVVIKPIYFPFQSKLNDSWGLRAAIGMDWTVEFGNEDEGIGVGADTISPIRRFRLCSSSVWVDADPAVATVRLLRRRYRRQPDVSTSDSDQTIWRGVLGQAGRQDTLRLGERAVARQEEGD